MRLFLLAVAVLILLSLGISLAASGAWERIDVLREELARIERQNVAFRVVNLELSGQARLLRESDDALEQVARHEYGLVRADERVFHIGSGGRR